MLAVEERLDQFGKHLASEWVAAFTPIARSVALVAMQTAAQLTGYSYALMDAANTHKPFRRERERYLRRRRQTRATFHGK